MQEDLKKKLEGKSLDELLELLILGLMYEQVEREDKHLKD